MDKSIPNVSQIGNNGQFTSYFNEADMSMMEEVNKLLTGLGGMPSKRGSINTISRGANLPRPSMQMDPEVNNFN